MVDLEIEDSDGAPESRVTTIAIQSLLIRFVCPAVLGPSHIRAPSRHQLCASEGSEKDLSESFIQQADNYLPASKDFVRYWMARSWFWNDEPC